MTSRSANRDLLLVHLAATTGAQPDSCLGSAFVPAVRSKGKSEGKSCATVGLALRPHFRPPCASMIPFAMKRPRPVPFVSSDLTLPEAFEYVWNALGGDAGPGIGDDEMDHVALPVDRD